MSSNKSGKPEPKSRNTLPRSASTLSDDTKASEMSAMSSASTIASTASSVSAAQKTTVVSTIQNI